MKQLIYNSSFFILLFIALAGATLVLCDWMKRASGQAFIKIDGDGKDYYSYLTSSFLTKDLAHLKPDNNFVVETPTGNINMHPVGVAVLQLPFFGLGYLAALLSKQPTDGYSVPFQLAISLAALVYLLTGLFFIYKTLVNSGFAKNTIFWALICLFFGTTLLNYTLTEPSMPHVYSFALISAFVYYLQKLSRQFSARGIYALALLFGLIILVRPVNAMVLLLIPFSYNSFPDFKNHVKKLIANKKLLITSLLTIVAVFAIQCTIWFAQTGQLFQSGYKGNGFYFSHPQFIPMLFGFTSGILVYTPLFLLMIPALIVLYKTNSFKAYSLVIFFIVALYIFSSYWGWTYFDGIGTRTIVDFYAIVAIVLCYLFTALRSPAQKGIITAFAAICILFNLVICYQYKEGIITSGGMNFEKFKYVFLKTSPQYKGLLGGCYDLQPYSAKPREPFITYEDKFEKEKNHFFNYSGIEYGPEFKSNQLNIDSRKIHVKISLDRLQVNQNMDNAFVSVALSDSANTCKVWQTFKMNDTPSTKNYSNWKHYDYGVNVVSNIHKTDQMAVFIWNKEKQAFAIDNFKVTLYDYGHIN